MLTQTIIEGWKTSAKGYTTKITELFEAGYPAWTVKTSEIYGVAIPLPIGIEVSEQFAGARLYNDEMLLDEEHKENALLLVTELDSIQIPFATLCAELILPGINGECRREIETSPVSWWIQWKELLGNKNVDDRVYDALGELCALKYLAEHGEIAQWNGPNGATYDIDCEDTYYEIKSTTLRKKRQITLNNHFQLDPPEGKKLKLILCQFEPAQIGYSIDSMVDELSAIGYSKNDLNHKLESLGLEKRKSSRKRCYDLRAMISYNIDEKFPAIREKSFVGGILPVGVESITYTITLDGLEGENLIEQQVEHEI